MVTYTVLNSNVIESCSYDEDKKQLTLDFKSGGSHRYDDVPKEIFDKMIEAESAGKFFHSHIRGKFTSERI